MVKYETTSKLFFWIDLFKSSYQNNTLRHKSTKTLMSPRYSIVTSSIHGHDYMICITQSQIHPTNIKVLQRVPQSYYRRVKNVCQPLCIGSQVSRNSQVDHQNIHQVAHDIPLSPQIIKARHTSGVLIKTQSDKITSKGKLNSSQESRGGETS